MRPLPLTTHRRHLACLLLAVLAACGSREVLQTYRASNAAGISFAGQWKLQGDPLASEREINRAIRATDDVRDGFIVPRQRQRQRQSQGDGRTSGGLVHVFFENGRRLKITQTGTALFVSFDRAVVEEYRFGENRDITVGQAEAQRVSGWDGADYVVETLDRNSMKLTERYSLADGGRTLTRQITFRSRKQESVSVQQRFRRND